MMLSGGVGGKCWGRRHMERDVRGSRHGQTQSTQTFPLDGLAHKTMGQRGMAHPDLQAEEDSSGGSEEGHRDRGSGRGKPFSKSAPVGRRGRLGGNQGSPEA